MLGSLCLRQEDSEKICCKLTAVGISLFLEVTSSLLFCELSRKDYSYYDALFNMISIVTQNPNLDTPAVFYSSRVLVRL
jgi:hypothetical protein